MNIYEIIILSLALALDAMVVSFSYGLIISIHRLKNSLKLAVSFGFFQALMPVIGWFLANFVYNQLKDFSKYIVFTVFIILALKFLKETFSKEETADTNCISLLCLFCLSIATSIDALGAGISLRLLNTEIWMPIVLIGTITFILSLTGFWFAAIFRKLNSKLLKILAVCIFVYLAIKSLF